jgi:thioredoxin reductase (NADPH)
VGSNPTFSSRLGAGRHSAAAFRCASHKRLPGLNTSYIFDLIIVGAGPSGLACAIEAKKAGLASVILEKGSLVDAIRRFPVNLVWFSTPELLEIGNVPFVVSTHRPTRVDTLNYYQKVAQFYELDTRLHDPVIHLARTEDLFQINTQRGRAYAARNVVLATGYFDHPNWLDITGETLPKVFHYYQEPFQFFDSNVAVVGGRNSAVEAALDLYRHGVRVTLIHRGQGLSEGVKYWILPDIENRIRNGEIKALFCTTVKEIGDTTLIVQGPDGLQTIPNDFTLVLIGFRPDTEQLVRFGIKVDPVSLAPEVNPETYESNVSGLYIAGSLVAGRNTNKVFVENGRTHGVTILAAIQGRN